jgi:dolichol-phosphate mannosyltransferase
LRLRVAVPTRRALVDYPRPKLVLNRLGNRFIQLLFRISYDDISNAFKMYRGR